MPKTEIDYSNTIIYKITCKDPNVTDVYVGHTTNFVQRKHAHKQSCINNKSPNYKCKLYEVIRNNGGWINWKMEIINFFECHDHYEARKKEQEYFISLNATLNSIEPMPKPKPKEIIIKKMITPNIPKNAKQYYCEMCDFGCCKKSEWDRHIDTKKHIDSDDEMQNISKKNKHICHCGKEYAHRQGLYTHKKICKFFKKSNIENVVVDNKPENVLVSDSSNNEIIHLLIKENSDFKTMIMDLVEINRDLQKQMLEVCKKIN